jgi:hypothetical protein
MTDLAVPAPAQLVEFFTAKWLAPVIGALAEDGRVGPTGGIEEASPCADC